MSNQGAPLTEFEPFPKLFRLSRECVISEKLDGRNAALIVTDDFDLLTASRTGFVTPEQDNQGFARWAQENKEAIVKALGPGRHYGEWWGQGVPESKRYGAKSGAEKPVSKRFSLFNTIRWGGVDFPKQSNGDLLFHVVPVLYRGPFSTEKADEVLENLRRGGSVAVPGCMDPEGIVVFHVSSNTMFKKTLGGDGHKGTGSAE